MPAVHVAALLLQVRLFSCKQLQGSVVRWSGSSHRFGVSGWTLPWAPFIRLSARDSYSPVE